MTIVTAVLEIDGYMERLNQPIPKFSLTSLPLGVLRRFARLAQTDFLALHLARIAGEKSRLAQRLPQTFVVTDEGACNPELDRAGLTAAAAAGYADSNVEFVLHGDYV